MMCKLGFQLYRTLLVGGLFAMLLPGAANAQTPIWQRQLGISSSDVSNSVSVGTLGNLYISGVTNGALTGANRGSSDTWVSK